MLYRKIKPPLWRELAFYGTVCFKISYLFLLIGAVNLLLICRKMKNYQCHICSSHSYNSNLPSGPLGPRQIGNYSALLNAYGVPSLRKRRLILKLSYLYNILNGRYSLPEPSPVETRTTSHFTRSHRHTLIVPRAHTNSYFYSFFCDTPRTWNTLPSHVVESSNADIFKRNLTDYLIN